MKLGVLRRVQAGAFLLASPLLAQGPPPTPAPTPRPGVVAAEEVHVLTLDVVAVDGKGRPVFGLTKEDFEVRVAGKIQTIDFFEPPAAPASLAAGAPKEGRPDSEERIAGTTTPFEEKGPTRHVLFYLDLEQLPHRSVMDSAASIRRALEHPAPARYGVAAYFTRTEGRVWDSNSADAVLAEADALVADVVNSSSADVSTGPGQRGSPRAAGAPPVYEQRKMLEKQLIDDLIFAEQSASSTGQAPVREIQAVSQYLQDERRRVKESVLGLRETCERFATLEGPRHLVILSEGTERIPGFNFLAHLKSEEMSRLRSPSSPSSYGSVANDPLRGLRSPAIPGAPGAAQALGSNRFVYDASPLMEVEELARYLATSGIIVNYVDPGSLSRDAVSAADRYGWESTRRGEDAKNLQETPMRFVSDTGGLARTRTDDVAGAVGALLDATSATYRIGMRLQGVDPRKTYTVKVATRKAGVNMYARNAFKPAGPAPAAAASLTEEARRAGASGRADALRPGAARTAKKAIPVTLEWRGKASTPSPDPGKPFWKLAVTIPHEELRFETESDAFVASVKIAVQASAVDGPLKDSATDDWFLSYQSDEYKEVRDTPASRLVTLQLPPGRYDVTVSVNDALAGTYGQATLRVDAR